MRYVKFLVILWLLGNLPACMTVTSVSVSQIPIAKERKNRIISHASSPVIFFIPFGTSYINKAQEQLLAMCPHAPIEGVIAKSQNIDYFFGLIDLQEVEFEGYCLSAENKG